MKNKNDEYIQGDLFDGWDTSREKIDEQMKIANEKILESKNLDVSKKDKPKQQWGVAGIIFGIVFFVLLIAFMIDEDVSVETNNTSPLFSEKF